MKKKVLIIVFSCVGALIAAVAIILGLTGKGIPNVPSSSGSLTAAPSNEAAIQALLSAGKEQTVLPDGMLGIWLDLNTDITPSGTDAQALYNEISSNFAFFTNFDANTLFIRPDTTGKTRGFLNYDGSEFDALGSVLSLAAQQEYFRVLIADDAMINVSGAFSHDAIFSVLNSYEFDAVLISSPLLTQSGKLSEFLAGIRQTAQERGIGIFIGLETRSLDFTSAQYAAETAAVGSGFTDFCVVNADCRTDGAPSFNSVMNSWNGLASSVPSVRFYCLHRNDKVYSGVNGWNDYLEIVYQYKNLWDMKNIRGSVFYGLSQMKSRRASSQRLSSMIYDGATSRFTVESMSVSPTANTVMYSGCFDTDRGLYCNRVSVPVTGDRFSVTYSLNPGSNLFCFENAGQYYNYRVYNNVPFISKAEHTTDGGVVNVTAVCLSGSAVYAVFAGEAFRMTQTGEAGADGFAAYSVAIDAAGTGYSSAALDVVCFYGTDSAVKELGTVNISGKKLFSPAGYTSSGRLSPFVDNGLGTAIMCEVIYDATEQLGILNSYDTYDPDKSTLLKGTLDYVNQINLTDDGNIRYELRSGVAVYAENCRLINNAFVLPKNNVSVSRVDDSGLDATKIYFNYDWLSPVTVTTAPNDYKTGYQSFSFNVDNYAAQYVDVNFGYTASVVGAERMTFDGHSPIASAEVLSSGGENTVLRLHLKKAGGFYGFSLSTADGNVLCLSVKKHTDNSVAGKTVMLDPGHGGLSMTGTAVAGESVAESQVTLSVALKVKQLLTNMGANVVMTRSFDTSLTLSDRVKICEAQKPDVFVSLHCDGADNTAEAGTHTFYFRPYSQPLAQSIHERLVHHYRTYIYTDADSNMEIVNKKIKYYPFFVTRVDTCPSVLCEMGFMSNPVESSVLLDENCQYWLADGIANGIADYFARG